MAARLFIGTQGWKVGAWSGPFYPHGTKSAQMLEVYAKAFDTVEVRATSYAIPAEPIVQEWGDAVPDTFRFALKVPQQITHERRLKDTEKVMRRFLGRAELLGERLGPLLVQMSPAFRPSTDSQAVLTAFLRTLPAGFQWAVEFRHPGWMVGQVFDQLRELGAAVVLTDGRWIRRDMMPELALEPTADFAYLRWEGTGRLLSDVSKAQIDRREEFDLWVDVVRSVSERVSTVYGYFDDQFQGHAPHSARQLQERFGLQPIEPEALREQAELF